MPLSLETYTKRLREFLLKLSPEEQRASMRHLARTDLYYLLRYVLNRPDVERQWLFDRCLEVQNEPNGHLDLWSREHYKSTVITLGKTIQDVLASHGEGALVDREITVGIFSHTRPVAKGFLRQIKYEFESNQALKDLFPDVVWDNPQAQAPKWSEDDGIILKRRSNPKEATVEAHGLVDGMPTGKHYLLCVYDDIVTEKSVTSPEMIQKTTDALSLSYNLGADGGHMRFVGTRYHYNDTYKAIIDRGTVKVRLHPATDTGKVGGTPVLLSREKLDQKRRDMGPYIFASQMLLDPKADEAQGFQEDWLRWGGYNDGRGLNKYILVDPAGEKKKTSDYTVILVVGIGPDDNWYLLDGIRDRLNLTERARQVMSLHRDWKPLGVGYEKYGIQADIEYIKILQKDENYRFDITPLGGSMAKNDRIRRLIPLFESGRVYLPNHIRQVNYEKKGYDLVHEFTEEYKAFPVSAHDDILDAFSRIMDEDLMVKTPKPAAQKKRGQMRVESSYNVHAW